MTKEEAIRILSTRDSHGMITGYAGGVKEAIDMGLEALKQQPCEDAISRAQAIEALKEDAKKYCGFMEMESYIPEDAIRVIQDLPAVTPTPKDDVLDKYKADKKDCTTCIGFGDKDYAQSFCHDCVKDIQNHYKADKGVEE